MHIKLSMSHFQHCFEDYIFPELINFRGGSVNKLHGGKIINAEEFILHPNFDEITYDNDVIKQIEQIEHLI
jgi:hypothetical protein